MWKLFFDICYFGTRLIPVPSWRESIRKNSLYDYKEKYRALRNAFPELSFRHVRMIKGGWNIGFIIDGKYVFKIRKMYDSKTPAQKIMREKRITDAFASVSPLRIPHIDVVKTAGFTFYKYDFIPGVNLNWFPRRIIEKYGWRWAGQLAEFIYAVHNARPAEIDDLRNGAGDGWNHNDICNNIIVDKKTMEIVALIDWEYAGWDDLSKEFKNCTAYSAKMKKSGIGTAIELSYAALERKNQAK